MESIDLDKQDGVIGSDYEDVELPNKCVWDHFDQYFEKFATLKAFVNCETEEFYTFKVIKEASLRFAKELKKYFKDGEFSTVAVILPNCLEYPIMVHASMAIGVPITPLRSDYQIDLLLSMMKDVNSKVLVIDESLVDSFKNVSEQLGELKIFVRGSSQNSSFGTSLHSVLFSQEAPMDVEEAKKVDPDSYAIVTYSSGTTGKPKAIMISQINVTNNNVCFMHDAFSPIQNFQNGKQEKLLGNLPFAHFYCDIFYFFGALMKGTCVYVTEFADAARIAQIANKFKLSVVTIRPYMVDAVSKLENAAELLKSVRAFVSAGSPPNPDAVKALKELLGDKIFFQDCYGTSETAAAISTPVNKERDGSTGKIVPNVKVKIVDINSGKPITKSFEKGELLIKVPWLMKGYLNNPEATKAAIEDGWYKTGDIAYFDEDKYLYVIERFRDTINFRGQKIFPSNVENIVKKHKSVLDVGVIGVTGEGTDGEVPRAFVCVKDSVTEQDIVEFVRANAPVENLWLRGGVQFLPSIPRTHLGKIQRKYLRDMGWTGSSTFQS